MTTASFLRQYETLCYGSGAVDLTGWSSFRITGADRRAFLHNFCTNDVRRLTPGTSCEVFFTNVKGRTIGHGLVHERNEELTFFGAPGQSSRLINHLDRYIIREDVHLHDTTDERVHILIGSGTAEAERFGEWQSLAEVAGKTTSFAWNLVGRPFTVIVVLAAVELNTVLDSIGDTEIERVELSAFNAARIEAAMPLYGIDFDDRNFPQEVGRDRQAISFTKGCYLGQEPVARIDALGHVNQRLVGVRFFENQLPEVGAKLQQGSKEAGCVTSLTFSPRLKAPLALAMVRRESNSLGTRLESGAGPCEVIALPLDGGDNSA
jgi:tRNA-modifying protein YgfZ